MVLVVTFPSFSCLFATARAPEIDAAAVEEMALLNPVLDQQVEGAIQHLVEMEQVVENQEVNAIANMLRHVNIAARRVAVQHAGERNAARSVVRRARRVDALRFLCCTSDF
jgi:hypothetical protein